MNKNANAFELALLTSNNAADAKVVARMGAADAETVAAVCAELITEPGTTFTVWAPNGPEFVQSVRVVGRQVSCTLVVRAAA